MESSTYVVIGAGLAGAATAWQLARAGHEVSVVERTNPAAADGSSHGSARIFRYGHDEPFWMDLVVRARAVYDELEAVSGTRLITGTGSLDFGRRRQPALLARLMADAGVEHELLTAAQARERWPQIAIDGEALWHPAAGVIDAERTVEAMLAQARQHGARVFTHWPVEGVERVGSRAGFRLLGPDGQTLEAGHVVVAAGGFLPALLDRLPLPAGFRASLPALRVTQETAVHFPYADPFAEPSVEPFAEPSVDPSAEGSVWPTFIHDTDALRLYCLPGGRDAGDRGQKIAEFGTGRPLGSALDQDGVVDTANVARLVDYVRRHLPGPVPEPYASTTCLFTLTPTDDFLIDGADGITLVSPCSGHGAKFAPLVGQLAAQVATGGAPVERFTAAAIARAG